MEDGALIIDFPHLKHVFFPSNVKSSKYTLFARSNQPLAAFSDDVWLWYRRCSQRFSHGFDCVRHHGLWSIHPRADTECLPGPLTGQE
jgi:hypothetical protein